MKIADQAEILDLEGDEGIFNSLVETYLEVRHDNEGGDYYPNSESIIGDRVDRFVEDVEIGMILQRTPELGLSLGSNILIHSLNLYRTDMIQTDVDILNQIDGKKNCSIIFTLGKGESAFSGGSHFVASRVFRDPETNEMVVLYRDSIQGEVSEEFKEYIRGQFGDNLRIVNVENQPGVMQQNDGTTCALRSLASQVRGGLFDRIENGIRDCGGLDNFIKVNSELSLVDLSIGIPEQAVAISSPERDVPPSIVKRYVEMRISELLENMTDDLVMEELEYLLHVQENNNYSYEEVASLIEEAPLGIESLMVTLIHDNPEFSELSIGEVGLTDDGRTVDVKEVNFSITDYDNPLEEGSILGQIDKGNSYSLVFKVGEDDNSFIPVRVFRDPITEEVVVLHIDPRGDGVDRELQAFLSREVGKNENMKFINGNGFGKSEKPRNNMVNGFEALAALADNGPLARMQTEIVQEEIEKIVGIEEVKRAVSAFEQTHTSPHPQHNGNILPMERGTGIRDIGRW
ncbi:MAG: hypothetical protein LBB24_02390 [Rickettsiales bacterium]|jgi:hypothetical protein|nr:hypothetical protein [Rickettsiales bacterium]